MTTISSTPLLEMVVVVVCPGGGDASGGATGTAVCAYAILGNARALMQQLSARNFL